MKIKLQPDGPTMREPSESEMDSWLANLREDDAAEPADTPTATEAGAQQAAEPSAPAPEDTGAHQAHETSSFAAPPGAAGHTGPHELTTTSGSTGPFAILPPKPDQPYGPDTMSSGAFPVLDAPTRDTSEALKAPEVSGLAETDGEAGPELAGDAAGTGMAGAGVTEAGMAGTGMAGTGVTEAGTAEAGVAEGGTGATGAWAPTSEAAGHESWAAGTGIGTEDAWTPGPWAPGADNADHADAPASAPWASETGTPDTGAQPPWTPVPADTSASAPWVPETFDPGAHAAWTPGTGTSATSAPAPWGPVSGVTETTAATPWAPEAQAAYAPAPWAAEDGSAPLAQPNGTASADAETPSAWTPTARPEAAAEASVTEIGPAEIDASDAEDESEAEMAATTATPIAPATAATRGTGEFRVVPVGRRRMLIPGRPPQPASETPVRALIGEQLRTPTVWCELDRNCISWHADREALGVADVRERAIKAGWRVDALGRLACPQCQQTSNDFRTTQPIVPWNRAYALTMAARQAARQGSYQYPQPAFYPR